uniref:SKI/SNO/DAC domain-containing protein n=1 Tax=Seriola lalandi dorsalis TaxID=1841481 RepID=A0A3B4XE85_SERLL
MAVGYSVSPSFVEEDALSAPLDAARPLTKLLPVATSMVEVHGVKVASFTVNGVELICLPQVFELFLKHLVGGLHTVYTKLKRLDISPVVCTVEQVRVLRGLGAIQPGVNRCKLITRADFETLYRDCTNARVSNRNTGNKQTNIRLNYSPPLLSPELS